MKHLMIVTMVDGRQYEARGIDTRTLAGWINAAATSQTDLAPLEWTDGPTGSTRATIHQAHLRLGHVSSIEAQPSLWCGVRSLFLEPGQVWEIPADAMSRNHPVIPTLVRVEEVSMDGAEDKVTFSVLAPADRTNGLPATVVVPTAAFVDVTSPVSPDRAMDYGVPLPEGSFLGQWPSEDDMRARLSS